MKIKFVQVICLFLLFSCQSKQSALDLIQVRDAVMNTDRAFSKMSEQDGYKKAFIAYADDHMIRLNAKQYATFGKESLIATFNKDTAYDGSVLTWYPLHAEVAASGDMASVFGDWKISFKLPDNRDTSVYGNYITVWKKQVDGAWKFILDGGNPTPGPTDSVLLNKMFLPAGKQ